MRPTRFLLVATAALITVFGTAWLLATLRHPDCADDSVIIGNNINMHFRKDYSAIVDLQSQLIDMQKQMQAAGVRPLPPGWSKKTLSSQNTKFSHATCLIPRIIHQTWKNEYVPMEFAGYMRSWINVHRNPSWSHWFWTDKRNRLLVETRFPQYLDLYDKLPENIMRADLIRYLILYEYGGVYADLDFEAYRPLDGLLAAHAHKEYGVHRNEMRGEKPLSSTGVRFSAMVGQEPYAHAHVLYKLREMVCNAIMISCPGHPIWLEVVDLVAARFDSGKYNNRVLKLTGPLVLQAALRQRKSQQSSRESPVMIADPELFYPTMDLTNQNLRHNCNEELLADACKVGKEMASSEKHWPADPDIANITKQERKKLKSALWPDQCSRRRETCDKLRRSHFRNPPKKNQSYANHHWKHSWLPGFENQFHSSYGGVESCSVMDIKTVLGSDDNYKKARRKCGLDGLGYRYHRHKNMVRSFSSMRWKGRSGVPDYCSEDRKYLCGDVKPGNGRTHECMSKTVDRIKDSRCQAFIQERIEKKQKLNHDHK